ncbi:uncharacterized protein LOC110459671 [Mizuhopecten yessoensis]|nr:uncharacterized protein LOC110459671 [Mizuhopecten yessoensis]
MDGPSDKRRGMKNYVRIIRALKLLAFIVLNLSLLLCTVSQRLALLSLIPPGKRHRCHQNEALSPVEILSRRMLLCCGICFPYLFIFLTGLWRFNFGKTKHPSLFFIVKVVVLETIPTVGIAFLVYRILPNLDLIAGTAILNACCLLPGVVNLMSWFRGMDKDPEQEAMTSLQILRSRILDGFGLLLQIGSIPYIVLADVYTYDTTMEKIGVVLCLAACSWVCWENVFKDFKCLNKFRIKDKQRPVLMMVSSLIKISVMFGIGISGSYSDFDKYIYILPKAFDKLWFDYMLVDRYFLVFIFSSFIGYHVAYTACKLNMQIFSFSLPLMATTPVTLIVHYLNFQNKVPIVDLKRLNTYCEFPSNWQVCASFAWVLSLYLIGRHIWTPHQERMAKLEALFVAPKYCGVLFEQQLVLNRRSNEHKISKNPKSANEPSNIPLDQVQSEIPSSKQPKESPPDIYACATLWHETPMEMTQLMKSLFVMDMDFTTRKAASTKEPSIETYEFESHILFDDAFENDKKDRRVPNKFVKQFVELLPDAASAAHKTKIEIDDPVKIVTPYGGQIVYQLPGSSLLYIHLKDKNVIRHRKRWSQVMYMYYLLGYRIGLNADISTKDQGDKETAQFKSEKAQNTYILALDGDVDFAPDAVRMLLDKMRKNHKVGASCGRIYPIGNGPMVWYQKFEYAVAHWLQKSTEHILGCVLCSPGCFSLFRGSALMDDNVMRKYAILPSEAIHHLMYDQGEDRWLCTLLLKQGYRVDYAAAADAYTYAPEGFDEFFNQRRRWMPSTMANIMDMLQDADATVKRNDNISRLYVFYQGTLMLSTMIGPATVLMMIAGAILTVFSVDLLQSYLISCLPATFFFFLCFWVPQKFQLFLAKLLSAFYMLIMTVVLVGCIVTAVEENPFHPSVIFLVGLVLIFVFTGVLHPMDIGCLLFGTLYFIGLPMGFLLLVIYSLCNLHVVSWGTREVSVVNKSKKELEEEAEQVRQAEQEKSNSFFARFFPSAQLRELFSFLDEWRQKKNKADETAKLVRELSSKFDDLLNSLNTKTDSARASSPTTGNVNSHNYGNEENRDNGCPKSDDNTESHDAQHKQNTPYWTKLQWLDRYQNDIMALHQHEEEFWKEFIENVGGVGSGPTSVYRTIKYLAPLDTNIKIQKETHEKLLDLRNGVCGGIAVINVVWMAVNFMFQLRGPGLVSIPIPSLWGGEDQRLEYLKVDVLGLSFVIFFMILLLIQFCGMIMHRWGTLLHLLAFTELRSPWGKTTLEENREQFLTRLKERYEEKMLSNNDNFQDHNDNMRKTKHKELKKLIRHIQEKGTKPIATQNESMLQLAADIHAHGETRRYTRRLQTKPEVGTFNYHLQRTITGVRKRQRPHIPLGSIDIPDVDY